MPTGTTRTRVLSGTSSNLTREFFQGAIFMHNFENQKKLEAIAERVKSAHESFNLALKEAQDAGLNVQYFRSNLNSGDKLLLQSITKKVTYEHKFL